MAGPPPKQGVCRARRGRGASALRCGTRAAGPARRGRCAGPRAVLLPLVADQTAAAGQLTVTYHRPLHPSLLQQLIQRLARFTPIHYKRQPLAAWGLLGHRRPPRPFICQLARCTVCAAPAAGRGAAPRGAGPQAGRWLRRAGPAAGAAGRTRALLAAPWAPFPGPCPSCARSLPGRLSPAPLSCAAAQLETRCAGGLAAPRARVGAHRRAGARVA